MLVVEVKVPLKLVGPVAGAVADALLPGPLDVIGLVIGFFGSLAEAKEKLKAEAYFVGFSEALAAHLLGLSFEWIREHLASKLVVGVGAFRGVPEQGNNEGIVDGYKFARGLDDKQQFALRAEGFAVIASRGHTIGPDFNLDDVVELAVALKSKIEEIFDDAREQEEKAARLRQEKRERENGHGHGLMAT